ncbi:MAG: transcriptional regulator [Candidatus Komeilibacteria bacterium RIFCSPHIGHO2_01_FULL_52_14]|uniref:Transcriptional regulator n=1 Tax=Candidatus Komeilibacteria bacterium RIFCSPHIGHO2_01_FULL_52_14 TaxID=1798549 RepID=A0A1G2BI42_9BACT|nr:MAG: transcriptional regulator [Candidatus Komeilibacteria bacterium RIFCSPHIGHO2_01_FULL_52_14]
MTHAEVKKLLFKDPEVKKAYDDLEFEFALREKIIEKRINEGLTQAKLAKRIGTKQSAISRFESGTSNPTLAFLRKLAAGLDVKIKISVS